MVRTYLSVAEFFLELEGLDVRDAARKAPTVGFRAPREFLRSFQKAEIRFSVVAFIAKKRLCCDLLAQFQQ